MDISLILQYWSMIKSVLNLTVLFRYPWICLNKTGLVQNFSEFVLNITGLVMNMTGLVLNMTTFGLNKIEFALHMT